MENKSHAIAAGVFVLALLALLAGLALWLTRDQGSYETYELSTPQAVTGLQPQAAVRYKGVSVGKVVSIGFDREVEGNVLIRIDVDENAPVTQNTFASLGYQGVTGLAYIDLDDAATPLVAEPLVSSRGYKRLPMRPSNLSQLAAMGPEVIGDVRETMARINSLLSDENQRVLIGTIAQFGQAAQGTTQLLAQLESSWSKDIGPTVASLSQGIGSNMQALNKTAASINAMSQEITKAVASLGRKGGVLDQLGQSMQSFAGVADEVNSATLPRILRTLGEVSAAMREISLLAREVADNPQALIYGPNMAQPGPGEQGHVAPRRR